MKRYGVRPSVFLFVPAWAHSSKPAALGLCTWGQMESADTRGKMDEKLKSENMQKRAVFYVYVIF